MTSQRQAFNLQKDKTKSLTGHTIIRHTQTHTFFTK
jgi:hypothetical protein